jgi:hypothetical protein
MKEPIQCALWTRPELASGPINEPFELLHTFVDESHWWRYLLRCRECSQLYFFELYEEIDWEGGGHDPQYSTFIPVEDEADVQSLKYAAPSELLMFLPRLQKDWPKGEEAPTWRWIIR